MSINNKWDSCAIGNYTSVEQIKKHLYKENRKYLGKHIEIRAILRMFLHEVINQNPKNVRSFAATVFDCNESPILEIKVNEQLKVVKSLLKGDWGEHDCDRLLGKTDSSHSLLSSSSIPAEVDGILRYCLLFPKC